MKTYTHFRQEEITLNIIKPEGITARSISTARRRKKSSPSLKNIREESKSSVVSLTSSAKTIRYEDLDMDGSPKKRKELNGLMPSFAGNDARRWGDWGLEFLLFFEFLIFEFWEVSFGGIVFL